MSAVIFEWLVVVVGRRSFEVRDPATGGGRIHKEDEPLRGVSPHVDDGPHLCGNQIYGAFVLNRRVDLYAIEQVSRRWRGDVGSSPLDGASAATSSPSAPDTLVDFHTRRHAHGLAVQQLREEDAERDAVRHVW